MICLNRITALMSRHRLFIDQPPEPDREIEVVGERAHYLSRVLRMKPGAILTVFANGGDNHAATIVAMKKNRVLLQIGDAVRNDTESALQIRLIQGISRGERMDFTVQKATELGVQQLQPVHTDFSVVKLDAERAKRRTQHWKKIAQGACEQSNRNCVPAINTPLTLNACLEEPSAADCRIVLLPGTARSFDELADDVGSVDVLVGPEGGFSEGEEDAAIASGFVAVSMGPRILRSETAAITAVAMAQAKWGDFYGAVAR